MNLNGTTLLNIFLVILAFVVVLAFAKFIFGLLLIAIPILVAFVIGVFILDKIQGGTAVEQLADKLSKWIKLRQGGS